MQTKDPPKRGRPSDYSTEIGDAICDRLVEGESLRKICDDAGMPDKATVFRWLRRHQEFRDQYTRARQFQLYCLASECLEIADDSSGDYVKKVLPNGRVVMVADLENLARSRLRISARLWLIARMVPKKYVDRPGWHPSGRLRGRGEI